MENLKVDFNYDLAQSFGVYQNKSEYDLLPYVSSVNISCGFHAADPVAIKKALLKAKENNVAIGAHIGFDDIAGFGYREMNLKPEEIEALVIYQVGALSSFANAFGLEIEHVRPHGAMYQKAFEDFEFSMNIARAIKKCNPWLIYVGAASETLDKVSEEVEIRVAHEVLLDKLYNDDSSVDLDSSNILPKEKAFIVLNNLIKYSEIKTKNEQRIKIKFDTVHFSHKLNSPEEILKNARELLIPTPLNYNRVKDTGWV